MLEMLSAEENYVEVNSYPKVCAPSIIVPLFISFALLYVFIPAG